MEVIIDFSQLDPDRVYLNAYYLTWKFHQAIEIIKSKIFKMAAPNTKIFLKFFFWHWVIISKIKVVN